MSRMTYILIKFIKPFIMVVAAILSSFFLGMATVIEQIETPLAWLDYLTKSGEAVGVIALLFGATIILYRYILLLQKKIDERDSDRMDMKDKIIEELRHRIEDKNKELERLRTNAGQNT